MRERIANVLAFVLSSFLFIAVSFPFVGSAYATWRLGTPVDPGLIGGYAALVIGVLIAVVVSLLALLFPAALGLFKGEGLDLRERVGLLMAAIILAVAVGYADSLAFSGSIKDDLTVRGAVMTISGHMKRVGGEGGRTILVAVAAQCAWAVGIAIAVVVAFMPPSWGTPKTGPSSG